MVCHVLLVETDNGLVLIDTGFGSKDCGDPAQRVGPSRYLIRPVLQREESAVTQVERLGFRRDDVRHIVITHFDCDHIGGISEFPEAQIHVTAAEAFGALAHPDARRAVPLPPGAVGARPQDRRAHTARREVARLRCREGA